jgi:hypothetical protein
VSTIDGTFGGNDCSGFVWIWDPSTSAYVKNANSYGLNANPGSLALDAGGSFWSITSTTQFGSNTIWHCPSSGACSEIGGTATAIAATGADAMWVTNGSNIYAFNGDVSNLSACAPPTQCWTEYNDTASTIAASGANVLAATADSTKSVFHLNNVQAVTTSEATFSGSIVLPVCTGSQSTQIIAKAAVFDADQCPADNQQLGNVPVTLDTGLTQDFAPGCDLSFAPGASACKATNMASVTCAQPPVILVSASPDPHSCVGTNSIPLGLMVWEAGNVGVYIDNIPTGWGNGGAIYNAICQGIQSWGPVDGKT